MRDRIRLVENPLHVDRERVLPAHRDDAPLGREAEREHQHEERDRPVPELPGAVGVREAPHQEQREHEQEGAARDGHAGRHEQVRGRRRQALLRGVGADRAGHPADDGQHVIELLLSGHADLLPSRHTSAPVPKNP